MSLPQFGDIGKEMKEMFSKGFDFDSIKLSMVSLQLGSMQYQGEQKMNKEGKMTGQLESKYEADGIALTSKLSTESPLINYELKVSRPELLGLTLTGTGQLNPTDLSFTPLLGASYSTSGYNIEVVNNSKDPKAKGNLWRASGVTSVRGFIIGASGIVDPTESKVMSANLVGGYQDGENSIFIDWDPQKKSFTGSAYKTINSSIQLGLAYAKIGGGEGGQPTVACCGSYTLNEGATMKARLMGSNMLGVAYTFKIKPGIRLTTCIEFDVNKMKEGDHKMGYGLEFF